MGNGSLAREALDKIEEHINQCIEANQKTAKWQGKVDETLEHQNADLTNIKSFLGRIMWVVVGTLFSVLAFLLWNGLKGLHG